MNYEPSSKLPISLILTHLQVNTNIKSVCNYLHKHEPNGRDDFAIKEYANA